MKQLVVWFWDRLATAFFRLGEYCYEQWKFWSGL